MQRVSPRRHRDVITRKELIGLSEFRHQIARFLRFSIAASREAGLTQTQYLLLLHIAGQPARDWAPVGELAERLQASPHATTALIKRSVAHGLVRKQRSAEDTRRVEVRLTARGAALVRQVAALHRQELATLRHIIRVTHVTG